MWADDASKIDMLAYRPYADLITEIAISERMNPLTIGLFGNWGSGKSTLLNLIEKQTSISNEKKVAVVKVNAWMFEGYEDAKTALMEAILQSLKENQTFFQNSTERIKGLMKRVNWMGVGKTVLKQGIPMAISGMTGAPLVMMPTTPKVTDLDTPEEIGSQIDRVSEISKEYLKDAPQENIVENIRKFREEFTGIINDSKVDNLVILIDDLDRCNPDRIVETLEAIKLFLSVEKTTFIIAMDENIITYSIKRKYPQLDKEGLDVSIDYIEKIIQLPIRIAELAESDVKNYMLLLIAEMFLSEEALNQLIEELKVKGIFIKGEIITGKEILEIVQEKIAGDQSKYKQNVTQNDFEEQLQIFNSIGSVVASTLKGNPRQTKRFLNTFYIRKRLAEIQQIDLNLSVLAKLMVLEYFDSDLFKELFQWQFENSGIPEPLKILEERVFNEEYDEKNSSQSDDFLMNTAWSGEKAKRWIGVEPKLSDIDLSSYFYLARDSVSDRKLFTTNLTQDERKFINQVCNLDTNKAIRRKKIEQLIDMDEITRSEIVKGVIEKYHQDSKQLETLIELYKTLPQYQSKLYAEFKKLTSKKVTIAVILLFQQLDEEVFGKLKTYYTEEKQVNKKLWEIVGE
ncbi:P-loop NTPase fold protein [Bacillus wiedmannii]|uniref:KAP family P-loop NTPase fold protein n=1 Tax=Bacillus wiedmannii TaxID=1890302 RepID=UPI002E23F6F1|nr:P-loop NTPase fold protein [Bacillus wiedmannii]